ncbi:receptor-like protein 33 [Bidens hawaiensis]|uniref:receptor-like protein 33 n=1 Tax=Bidens hawaiensis TaxID=980011 RepID=UPI00404936BD
MLEVLNLGKNNISDTYPCFLGKNANLRVLVLRSNRLHGSVVCDQSQHDNWSKLQIVDIASNYLIGEIPENWFWQWGAMMNIHDIEDPPRKKHISFSVLQLSDYKYQDTVTVTAKGLELELVKILAIFTSIDISNNKFSGEIPRTVGRLKALYVLNVSHNAFTGSIPPSLGNLSELESLDMSSNKLTGEIPHELARLPFLSTFNLSYNQLKGRIPTGNQLQTFDNDSYFGNNELCGFPVSEGCAPSIVTVPNYALNSQESDNIIEWQSVFYGLGFGVVTSVLFFVWKGYPSRKSRHTNRSR